MKRSFFRLQRLGFKQKLANSDGRIKKNAKNLPFWFKFGSIFEFSQKLQKHNGKITQKIPLQKSKTVIFRLQRLGFIKKLANSDERIEKNAKNLPFGSILTKKSHF